MKLLTRLHTQHCIFLCFLTSLTACQSFAPGKEVKPHIAKELAAEQSNEKPKIAPLSVPPEVTASLLSSIDNTNKSQTLKSVKRFEVNANEVPVRPFFAGLVEDTPYSVAVHPDVSGNISLTLKEVSLEEVITVVKSMYPLDILRQGRVIQVMPAKMRTEVIPVNYITAQRSGQSIVSVVAGGVTQQDDSSNRNNNFGNSRNNNFNNNASSNNNNNGLSGNQSFDLNGSRIQTTNDHDFWKDLEKALNAFIGKNEGRYVIVSPQASLVTVNALPSEIERLKEFLKVSQENLQRQVILEAKIIEVTLKDEYKQGVNWSDILGTIGSTGLSFSTTAAGQFANDITTSLGGVSNLVINNADFNGVISLLKTQGDVQMLSNPRVTATNNQKAVIKVGEDEYFVTDVSSTTVTGNATTTTPEIDLTPFFSGIALDVTPQIDKNGAVILHVHPSVTETQEQQKIITLNNDEFILPLAQSNIRESDTVIRAQSGEIVVIGGLMQTVTVDEESKTPLLGDIPGLGNLFKSISKRQDKKELVILLRPTVVMPDTWIKQQAHSRELLDAWYEN